ncbi:MAG: hypothetical protein ACR2KF_08545 [Nitrososphaeraceae archaeon]
MTIPYQLANKIKRTILSSSSSVDTTELVGLPFWVEDKQEHRARYIETDSRCCFNHAVGLPKKNGQEKPMFDYELDLIRDLEQHRYLFVLKATGLGISELFLRYIGYLCTKDDKLKGTQIVIVTGPRIELAITLISRLKLILYNKLGLLFNDKETVLELNGVHIEAFPSHHLDTFRGLASPSLILLDESDYFTIGQQQIARDVSERYIAKSNPFIIYCSTPNMPGGLCETIEKEKDSIYHRVRLPYQVGLGKIYSQEEITEQMKSPSFNKEYCLAYEGGKGNLFQPEQIDAIVKLAEQYKDIPINPYNLLSLGCDPAFGSSSTAIIVCEHIKEKGIIIVRHSELIEHGDPNAVADKIFNWHRKYFNCWIFIDGSSRALINLTKIKFNESLNWDTNDINPEEMFVCPVNFQKEHRNMITHLHMMVTKKYLVIPEKHDKLIISLRSATVNELSLDKDQSAYNDLFDALRMSLKAYNIK